MRVFFSLILLFNLFVCNSQSRIDSLSGDFLLKNHIIDTLIFNKSKKNNKILIESNYYTKEELLISLPENQKIVVFTFGSNSEHGDKFMVIDFLDNSNVHSYEFFGLLGIDKDLERLQVIFKKQNIGINTRHKKNILKILLSVY